MLFRGVHPRSLHRSCDRGSFRERADWSMQAHCPFMFLTKTMPKARLTLGEPRSWLELDEPALAFVTHPPQLSPHMRHKRDFSSHSNDLKLSRRGRQTLACRMLRQNCNPKPGDTGAEEMLKQINRSLKNNEKRK